MARTTFTTYINAVRDAGVQREFAALDQTADRTFANVAKYADAALLQSERKVAAFRNSFQDVQRIVSGLSSGLTREGGINLDTSSLRQAAADARFYEEGLRTALRTASLLQIETNDTSQATRNYVNALQASLNSAKLVTSQAEEQVATQERLQRAYDGTASRLSLLAQRERELYVEQARQAQQEVASRRAQEGFNSVFAPGLERSAASNGAGFGALEAQLRQSEALVEDLNRGVAELERRFQSEAAAAAREQEIAARATAERRAELARLAEAEAGAARGADLLAGIYRGTALEQGRATKSAQDMASAFQEIEREQAKAAREQEEFAATLARIRGQADPVVAVMQRYEQQLRELDQVVIKLKVDEAEAANLRASLTSRMEQQVDAVRRAQAATAGYGNTLRGQRTAYIQSGQQLQDIAISLAGGQRASTVFAQQLPQLAYAFVDVGGKVGKAATALSGPWSIALVAGAFLAGALIEKLFGLGDAHESAADSAKKEEEAIRDLVAEMDRATQTSTQLARAKYTEAEARRLNAIETLRELQSQQSAAAFTVNNNAQGGTVGGGNLLAATRAASLENQVEKTQKRIDDLSNAATRARGVYIAGYLETQATEAKRIEERANREIAYAQRNISDANQQAAAIQRIITRRNADLAAVKEQDKAQKAATRDAKAAAAQAEREAEAAAKRRAAEIRDEETLALLRRRRALEPGQFDREMEAINQRYSDEIVRIDALSTASNAGTQLQIANLKRVQEAAAKNESSLRGIVTQYLDAEPAVRKAARAVQQVYDLVGQPIDFGERFFTEQDAARIKGLIYDGLQRPYQEFLEQAQMGSEIARLEAAGYNDVAQALQTALSLREQGAQIGEEEFRTILDTTKAQNSLNRQLEDTKALNQAILGIVGQTKAATEDFVYTILRGKPADAIKNLGRTVMDNVLRIEAQRITAQLFAGADEKVRALIDDSQGVNRAIDILEKAAKDSGTALDTLDDVLGTASNAVRDFTRALQTGTSAVGAPGSASEVGKAVADGLTKASQIASASSGDFTNPFIAAAPDLPAGVEPGSDEALRVVAKTMLPPLAAATGLTSAIRKITDSDTVNGGSDGANIVVTARRNAEAFGEKAGEKQAVAMQDTYKSVFGNIGKQIDAALGVNMFESIGRSFATGGFGGASIGALFGGNGAAIGSVLGTAGTEIFGAGFGEALAAGSGPLAIASAANSFIGDIFGFKGGPLGVLTSPINSLINPSRSAGAVLTGIDSYTLGGKDRKQYGVATGLAGSVFDGLTSIADQLGADIGSFRTTIGIRDGDYRVNTTGDSLKIKNGAIEFEDDAEAAIAFAIQDAIQDGALVGISNASQKILTSGQDLEKAIMKATAIESIPKRLMQLTDPVRYAVTELNKEFEDLISYLKEGGATAEQFAQAQELYDLERANAIEQATNSTVSALENFMEEMLGGSSSPLSRRTVYGNAQSEFDALAAKVNAGEAVSEEDLLQAAQNLQAASGALFGSTSAFFADFNRIYDTVAAAKDNLEGSLTSTGDLPASPFTTDTAVADTIAKMGESSVAATNAQTSTLNSTLEKIADILADIQASGTTFISGSSLDLLSTRFQTV